jgi:3-oxoacyl-[acyl-carrier protein] reductase
MDQLARRAGRIIDISSVAGAMAGRGQTNYAASKGAVNAFTKALAVELAPRKITVNAVARGLIETGMSERIRANAGDQALARILLRRYGQPVEVAYAVVFLASRFADRITGQIIYVDGGFKME